MLAFPISHFGSVNDPGTLKTSLISLWELNEASGSVLDAHNSNNLITNGTNSAPTYGAAGKLGDSISLDGTDDYIEEGANSNNTFTPAAAHSVNTWVYRAGESVDKNSYLVSKMYSATGYRVYLLTMVGNTHATTSIINRIYFGYYDSANLNTNIIYNAGGSDLWTGQWTMLTTTRSGSSMKLYVNGEEVATGSGGNGSGKQSTSTNVHWCLGAAWKSTTTPDVMFNGSVDQTGVWGKALTQQEIDYLYNKGSGIAYTAWT